MSLPILLKAAVIGGAAYAASRWYASHRASDRTTAVKRLSKPAGSQAASDEPDEVPRPASDTPSHPAAWLDGTIADAAPR